MNTPEKTILNPFIEEYKKNLKEYTHCSFFLVNIISSIEVDLKYGRFQNDDIQTLELVLKRIKALHYCDLKISEFKNDFVIKRFNFIIWLLESCKCDVKKEIEFFEHLIK